MARIRKTQRVGEERFTDRVWTIRRLNATAIEQESDRCWCLALSLAEGIHQLLQGCGPLDLEEDLVVVVGDLYIEMLAGRTLRLLCRPWASVVRSRHLEDLK